MSDLKNAITVPPTRNEDETWNYGASDYMMSYFDISSAEVKSAGFQSGDDALIRCFKEGRDVYILSAKMYLGEDGFNNLSKKDQKMWRKRFKTVCNNAACSSNITLKRL